MRRWTKLAVVSGLLLQVGTCISADALVRALEDELIFSATSFTFTAAQTIFMNYLGL